jgi:PTH1 family peptidyl-tRNA hydrolase
MSTHLIVGIGNPGEKYTNTRHNFGFEVLDAIAKKHALTWKKCGFTEGLSCQIAAGKWLLKPSSYVNQSGEVVKAFIDWFKLKADDLIVVVDDVQLPLGSLRFRNEGSDGGHNGLKSVEQHLGTSNYARLRGGVGQPGDKQDLAVHVLSKFHKDEQEALKKAIAKSVEIVEDCLLNDVSIENKTWN